MGAASSKIEEDKALQLCRERKKFVRQALDGRCSIAAAHVMYIQSLKNTGTALRKFIEPEAPIESSLYTTSTSATPEPLGLTDKSLSRFSFSSPSASQPVDATEAISPSSSPPNSSQFQVNHMTFRGASSEKIEEKPSLPVTQTLTSSSTPLNNTPYSTERPETSFEVSSPIPGNDPWDYFGLFHPTDHQFSFQHGKEINQGLENVDDLRRLTEEEGIPQLEDEGEEASFDETEESQDSEDEFSEPSTNTLVRSFENLNRIHDQSGDNSSSSMPSARNVALKTQFMNGETKGKSPDLSPLRDTSKLVIALPTEGDETPLEEEIIDSKIDGKDFISSIREIEILFIKASESGKEVPRMLEANKLHFRPIFLGKERGGSTTSTFLKFCFSCGEDPTQVQEEPAQNSMKYLTWHRTLSSRSTSSRNPLGANSKENIEDLTGNLFDNYCMISGSHASTLDRLYAWERKLYDEVKASGVVRREYDLKCKLLRHLESSGEGSHKVDKVRAVVKDLHSRIRVAIHRIDSISKRVEDLRDKELQPQLEELIEGLSRMWKVMFDCHKLQFHIISVAHKNGNTKISIQSEPHRQIAIHLENELCSLSSSLIKWIGAQKSYLQAIYGWLVKCAPVEQKSSKRKRKKEPRSLRNHGPPIYVTCGVWLEELESLSLPLKQVVDSMKSLADETGRFVPSQEKNQGKDMNRPYLPSWKADNKIDSANILRDEAPDEWISCFERFRSSLVGFIGQLSDFAESSVKKYVELEEAIQGAKTSYDHHIHLKSRSQVV